VKAIAMKKKRLAALPLVVLTLFLACSAPAAPQAGQRGAGEREADARAVRSKSITAAITGEAHTFYQKLNPRSAVRGVEEVEKLVSAAFAVVNDRGGLTPQIADSVPSIENGLWKLLPDGRMETAWKIKPEARWHDGTPVTADDAVFAARIGLDRDLALFRDPGFDFVDRVEALDARTVMVTWKQPYIEADTMFTHELAMPLPKHLLEQAYLENKEGFTEIAFWTSEFVGSGPYRVREYVSGSHVALEASSDYVLGRPKIDEVLVKFIADTNAIIANVLATDVDLTLGRGVSIEQAAQVRAQWTNGVVAIPLSSVSGIFPQFMNPDPLVVANVEFRRALMHAIDRAQMVETIQNGLVPVAHTFLTPEDEWYPQIETILTKYDYDPRKTTQLMEGLGYRKGQDGGYLDASGRKLSVEARATMTDINQKSMLTVADFWQRSGIAVETTSIAGQRARDLEYRASYPGFQVQRQGTTRSGISRFHSTQALVAENRYVGSNNPRYQNPRMDALIDRYLTTIPPNDRLQVAREILAHVSDQLVWMILYYDSQPVLVSNRLEHVSPGGQGETAWNAHLWDVKQ
jgi:peptide/nickel transport system substrate-binding protein